MNNETKYYNFNYKTGQYFEVSTPLHDHYTYDTKTNSFFEDILVNNKCYTFKQIQDISIME